MTLTEYTRVHREICGTFDLSQSNALSVFVGLHNAHKYLPLIQSNLESQHLQNFYLLVIDNASTDNSWDLALNIAGSYPGKAVAVRNPLNLGGAGSLYANLDLVPTDWLVTMHQDDLYLPNHFTTIADLISKAKPDTAIVSTSMGRADFDKGKLEVVPRLGWMMDENSSNIDLFLATLRQHFVPFPASAFSVSKISKFDLAWHDTSFPDSELVLKLLGDYSIKISPEITMGYRENPTSESHAITDHNRKSGQFMSLLRVFSSSEFLSLAKTVTGNLQRKFFAHAMESIAIRLGNSSLAETARLSLANNLAIAWNYSCVDVNDFLLEKQIGESGEFSKNFLISAKNYKSQNSSERVKRGIASNVWMTIENEIDPKLPGLLRARRWLLTRIVRVLARLGIRKDFDFDWKRK
jgi:glycosyltransferase involved in cell wall biosynthesis